MNITGTKEQLQLKALLYHDNANLNQIKQQDTEQGLALVAEQFEAMFLQLVLKQMRSSNDVLADENSPFSSQQYGVFRDMYDGQLAMELAKNQQGGIAEMLVKQLSPNFSDPHFQASNESKLTQQSLTLMNNGSVSMNNERSLINNNLRNYANDGACIVKAEARSQAHVAPDFNPCELVNVPTSVVTNKENRAEVLEMSSAFTQPLFQRRDR